MTGRGQSSAGCKTHPRSWVNTLVVCSAEVAAAGKPAAGFLDGHRPAQGCLHHSAGTAGMKGAEQAIAQADMSPGMGWRQIIRSLILELPVAEQKQRSCIFCETRAKEKLHNLAWDDKEQTGPCSNEPLSMGGQELCGLLVQFTDPYSDVWDPANKIITSSKSQSCFVGTMSFLSSLHL